MTALRSRVYKDPKRVAADVLTRSGSPRTPGGKAIDVASILRDYAGFDVAHVPNLNPGGQQLLGLYIPEHNIVMVESNCIESRKRFSMAHELGHAELQFDFGRVDGLFSTAKRPIFVCTAKDEGRGREDERAAGAHRRREIRANQFAAELLMPASLVREVWSQYGNIELTADALIVSRQALGYRLRELRLI